MVKAQLSFPNGNVLNLITSEQYLYIETRVIFNTGNFKANDYSWDKKLDSIDSNWFVTACFNGDCKNDLLQSGTFLKDFGLNDTTCFIAFHVETHEYTGNSKIIYRVFNKNNPLDSATLYFNISYSKPSGMNDLTGNNLSIYPNPVVNKISIKTTLDLQNATLKIINSLGETIIKKQLDNDTELDVSNLKNGVYLLSIVSDNYTVFRKFIKQ
ncbi:MAG: T9SS type A sorting domain-containing protein [Bacteroidia bacterium]|nr:T9SS type A sorting domain-containing protein [Bacteroidia bacterium]